PNISAKGLKIDTITGLNNIIQLMSDTEFFGRPYFNSDTAGFAQIKKGAEKVVVTFEKEYLEQPIVNVTISFNGIDKGTKEDIAKQEEIAHQLFNDGTQYMVINKTKKGFTIILNKFAPQGIDFSWLAIAVKHPRIAVSDAGDDNEEIDSSKFDSSKKETSVIKSEETSSPAVSTVNSPSTSEPPSGSTPREASPPTTE
ncbi:MAG: H-type lectin domain-containing protein, partial [bacterium]|nr:H-type lectin domain-containing protein [bacterium]